MPNYSVLTMQYDPNSFPIDTVSRLASGIHVVRPSANLPQTGQAPLFTIAGGTIMLLGIIGVVSTVIQTQACNAKLVYNPTVGADVDMCATLDISADAVGSFFTITGTLANAMLNAVLALRQATPHIQGPGTIDLNCSASNTGQVKWIATYVALEPGATVVAA